MLNDAVEKLTPEFEVPTHKSLSNWDRLPILVILAILIFLIFARTGESIHGQISKLGEYLWKDYFELRHDVPLPSCDRNLDVDKKLQELQLAAGQKPAAAADDLFGDEFDPVATRSSLQSQKESCLEQFARYDHYKANLTTGVIILRAFEEKFSQASVFATAQQRLFLVILLFVAAGVATHNRHHIAFRPML
ncbi:MAG TPA: hypothetical protein VFM46_12125, partial [Pseudomonadales bacterium]|nr:hypothetical protein [Pseudomonadales bacterium]